MRDSANPRVFGKGTACMRSRSPKWNNGRARFVAIGVIIVGSALVGPGLAAQGRASNLDDRDAAGRAASPAPSPAEERLKWDVTYLAADERDGRAPGTKGIESAADYVAHVFRDAGLRSAPGAEGFFQPF